MNRYAVTGFSSVPPFAQGLVRDLRVRWALMEAGVSYDVELIDLSTRTSDAYRQKQPFGMVPAFVAGELELFESGAIVQLIAERSGRSTFGPLGTLNATTGAPLTCPADDKS